MIFTCYSPLATFTRLGKRSDSRARPFAPRANPLLDPDRVIELLGELSQIQRIGVIDSDRLLCCREPQRRERRLQVGRRCSAQSETIVVPQNVVVSDVLIVGIKKKTAAEQFIDRRQNLCFRDKLRST